jgi:hypothetical protein
MAPSFRFKLMKKLLHLPTQTIRDYPRGDDLPVVGLSQAYAVLDVLTEPVPTFDPAIEVLHSSDVLDAEALTLTTTYSVTVKPVIYPDAAKWQVREWLIENGIMPTTVPSVIEQLITNPVEQAKALNRWEHVESIPRFHPLVVLLGNHLGLTEDEINAAWSAIVAKH